MVRHDSAEEAALRTEVRTRLEANVPASLRGRTNRRAMLLSSLLGKAGAQRRCYADTAELSMQAAWAPWGKSFAAEVAAARRRKNRLRRIRRSHERGTDGHLRA
jgi:hypothetical protein